MTECLCCKRTESGKSGHFCDNCWLYLMPDVRKGEVGVKWGDIWAMLCGWHATHKEDDKDYEFVHQIILGCYKYEGRS